MELSRTKTGIPLLTSGLAKQKHFDLGWVSEFKVQETRGPILIPTAQEKISGLRTFPPITFPNTTTKTWEPEIPSCPALSAGQSLPPLGEVGVKGSLGPPDLDPHHVGYQMTLSPQDYGKSPREIAGIIVKEQAADVMSEKEYLGYIHYLIGNCSKYEIFSLLHPQNTMVPVLRINQIGMKPTSDREMGDNGKGMWYQNDATYGARIQVKNGDDELFFKSILAHTEGLSKEFGVIASRPRGIAIWLTYQNHTNLIWISPPHPTPHEDFKDGTRAVGPAPEHPGQIWRFEPEVPADDPHRSTQQRNIDGALESYFGVYLSEYKYRSHHLEEWQCVQAVRGRGRIHGSNPLCEDYSLLYAIRRMKGMSHEGAALDLVIQGDKILHDLEELFYHLAIAHRRHQFQG